MEILKVKPRLQPEHPSESGSQVGDKNDLESSAIEMKSVAHDKVCNTAAARSAFVSKRNKMDAAKLARDPNIPKEEHRKAKNAS